MALVRISRQLISDVETRCNVMRNAEVNEQDYPSTERQGSAPELATIQAFMWGDHEHLRTLMPTDWCAVANDFSVTTTYRHDDGHLETTAPVTFTFSSLMTLPPKTSLGYRNGKYNCAQVNVQYEVIEQAFEDPKHPHHMVACAVMAIVDREKRQRKIETVWRVRVANLKDFLGKCKSLNEAIKLWPQVKLYVPQSYIDTVETPVVRTQAAARKEKVTEGLDTDGLTAAAIAAKLAGVL
ncbi:MAG: hypothetical protein RJA99_3219 [Pseudomonadota bacterium]|jgi:hypothetical protein